MQDPDTRSNRAHAQDVSLLHTQYGILLGPLVDTQLVYGTAQATWLGLPYTCRKLLAPRAGLGAMLGGVGLRLPYKADVKSLYRKYDRRGREGLGEGAWAELGGEWGLGRGWAGHGRGMGGGRARCRGCSSRML